MLRSGLVKVRILHSMHRSGHSYCTTMCIRSVWQAGCAPMSPSAWKSQQCIYHLSVCQYLSSTGAPAFCCILLEWHYLGFSHGYAQTLGDGPIFISDKGKNRRRKKDIKDVKERKKKKSVFFLCQLERGRELYMDSHQYPYARAISHRSASKQETLLAG